MTTYTEKNFSGVATTTAADLYVPSGAIASQIVYLQICNKSASAATASVFLYDNSVATSYEIVASVAVPANSTLPLIYAGKIILESGDKLRLSASANASIVAIGSSVERS